MPIVCVRGTNGFSPEKKAPKGFPEELQLGINHSKGTKVLFQHQQPADKSFSILFACL